MPPTPTGQTLTTTAVAEGVAKEITTPRGGTVWSQALSCQRLWLPAPKQTDLAKVYIAVIAVGRSRSGGPGMAPRTPLPGRFTRAAIRSTHRIKVSMQKRINPDPATYDGELTDLAAFLMQVDDYWNVAHRQVYSIDGLTDGQTNVVFFESSLTIYEPRAVDEQSLWSGELMLTFSEVTPW